MLLSESFLVSRWLHFMSLFAFTGLILFAHWLAPASFATHLQRHWQALLRGTALLAWLSGVLIFLLQCGQMGEGWHSTVDPALWVMLMQTQWGQVWCWHIVAGTVTLIACFYRNSACRTLLFLALSSQFVTLSLVGHVAMSVGITGVAHRFNQFFHLLSAAFWSGGLLALIAVIREVQQPHWRPQAITTMMRFSRYGHLAVAGVIISGFINMLLISGWKLPDDSLYMRLLWSKIVLVAMMVILALMNRYFWLPRMKRHSDAAKRFFLYFTIAEQIIAVMVLLLVSQFAMLQP